MRKIIVCIEHTGYYACTLCRVYHDAGALLTPADPLFEAHKQHQNRHGIRSWRERHCWKIDDYGQAHKVPACEVMLAGEY